jgi:hypothetical protein
MIDPKYIDRLTLLFVCVVAGLGVASFLLANYFGAIELPDKTVSDAPVRQLTLVTEMIKLVLTLATGLAGGTIWLFTRPLTDEAELKKRIFWGGLAFLSLCVSMYFGFVALDGALNLLSAGVFDSRANLVWWPQTLQYYAFVIGALLLGIACLRSINAVIDKKKD